MARTHTEILAAIRADFVANLTLQEAYGLDASLTFDEQFSVVSLESIITYIVASAIYTFELIIGQKQTDLEAKIALEYPFTKEWYKSRFLLFQLGDALEFSDNTFSYTAIDESKQLVNFVAIREREVEGVTKLQVFATKENKEALTVDELAAFKNYVKQIAAAGTHFEFVSMAPDELEINLTITYDPQLLSSTGETLADGSTPVRDAVTSYLDGIKYSGKFNRTRLVDAVQQATGVLDVVLGSVKMNDEAVSTQSFESPSGFFVSETINETYTAGNSDDY